MSRQSLLYELSRGVTLSGHDIFRRGTDDQNHLRSAIAELYWDAISFLRQKDISDTILRDSIEKLRAAYLNPDRRASISGLALWSMAQGGKSPLQAVPAGRCWPESFCKLAKVSSDGYHFEDGTPLTKKFRLDYFDFIGIALSAGFPEFQRFISLDSQITYEVIFGIITLLLIDSAVLSLEKGDAIRTGVDLLQAAKSREEMRFQSRRDEWGKKARTTVAGLGGRMRHKETNSVKQVVIEKWIAGEFGRNKSAAARWVMSKFSEKIRTLETVRRWIREYECSITTTEQADE